LPGAEEEYVRAADGSTADGPDDAGIAERAAGQLRSLRAERGGA